jgi:hypothetical protein
MYIANTSSRTWSFRSANTKTSRRTRFLTSSVHLWPSQPVFLRIIIILSFHIIWSSSEHFPLLGARTGNDSQWEWGWGDDRGLCSLSVFWPSLLVILYVSLKHWYPCGITTSLHWHENQKFQVLFTSTFILILWHPCIAIIALAHWAPCTVLKLNVIRYVNIFLMLCKA